MDGKIKSKSVIETEDLFEEYKSGDRATWSKEAVEDRDFTVNKMWLTEDAESVEAANQPAMAINEVTPAMRKVVSELTSNKPRFTAIAKEDSDVNTASAISDLVSHIWSNSKGNVRVKASAYDFEITGLGALMAYYDPFDDMGRGELKIIDVDPLDLYIDPNSKEEDSSDASNIIYSQIKTKEQIKVLMPGFDFKKAYPIQETDHPTSDRYAGEGQIMEVNDDTHFRYRIIDRYHKKKVKRFHVFDPKSGFDRIFDEDEYIEFGEKPAFYAVKDGGEEIIIDEAEVDEMTRVYLSTGGVYHLVMQDGYPRIAPYAEMGANALPGSTTKLVPTTMTKLLHEGYLKVEFPKVDRIQRQYIIGGVEVANSIMPISQYPIVTYKLHSNRNPFPMGDIRLVKPLQDQVNKITSIIMVYNRSIANLDMYVPEGFRKLNKNLESRVNKPGKNIYEYDPDGGGIPIFAQYAQMGSPLYEEKERLIIQIQRIMGAFPFQDGMASNAPNTYRGTLAIDEMAMRASKFKRKSLEDCIAQLGRVIVEWIPHVYKERKVLRLLKANNQVKATVVNDEQEDELMVKRIINDVTIGTYDIQVVAGSMLESNRWAEYEILENAWEKGLITNRATVLRKLDVDDIEDEIKSGDTIAQLQSQMAQMDAEIKKLSGDLQTANRAEVQSRKKVEVEKFKSDLLGMSNEVKANAKIANLRMNDEVKDSKAETKKINADKPKDKP